MRLLRERVEVAAGANVGADVDEKVVVDATRFLPLDDPDAVAVSRPENVRRQRIETTLRLAWIEDVLCEGQREEADFLKAV